MRHFILPVLFTCCLFSCGGPVVDVARPAKDSAANKRKKEIRTQKPGLVYGVELHKGIRTAYDDAFGRWGDTVLICGYRGKVEMTDTLNKKRTPLFDLHAEFMVDKMFLIPLKDGSWFAVWQETDHEGVKSYIARYTNGAPKPEWKQMFNYPNPGTPVLDGDHAYVTTLGMVGKIETTSGNFAWKYDSLYNQMKHSFNKFEKPIVYPDQVIFVDLPVKGKRERRDTLFIDPVTGARK